MAVPLFNIFFNPYYVVAGEREVRGGGSGGREWRKNSVKFFRTSLQISLKITLELFWWLKMGVQKHLCMHKLPLLPCQSQITDQFLLDNVISNLFNISGILTWYEVEIYID